MTTTSKFAILVGSIANGFSIEQIVDHATAAENIVIKHLANGLLAESLPVRNPSDRHKHETNFDHGIDFVVFGQGIGNGFSIYGPFPDFDRANEFGEDHRHSDQEWECLQHDSSLDLVMDAHL